MKNIITNRSLCSIGLSISLCGALFIAAGCGTMPVVSTNPTTGLATTNLVEVLDPLAAEAISGVLSVVTPLAVKEDTNAASYLALAANVFSMASESGVYDPVQIQAALDAVSVKELRQSAIAKQVVTTIMNTYKGFAARAVNSKVAATKWGPFAQGLLGAMATGIQNGLKPGN